MANNFNERFDCKKLVKDLDEVKENGGGDFEDVPFGEYVVHIDKIELGETSEKAKNPGLPKMVIWYTIVDGDYKGQKIFQTQGLYFPSANNPMFGMKIALDFLESLNTDVECEFRDFDQFEEMLLDIAEKSEAFDYQLSYKKGKNDYPKYKIEAVFEAEK